jgi:hypothetical protein
VRTFASRPLDLIDALLGDLGYDDELVKRPLVLARGDLHDGGEEGLRIEEA